MTSALAAVPRLGSVKPGAPRMHKSASGWGCKTALSSQHGRRTRAVASASEQLHASDARVDLRELFCHPARYSYKHWQDVMQSCKPTTRAGEQRANDLVGSNSNQWYRIRYAALGKALMFLKQLQAGHQRCSHVLPSDR